MLPFDRHVSSIRDLSHDVDIHTIKPVQSHVEGVQHGSRFILHLVDER
jgi:hypothetical protein